MSLTETRTLPYTVEGSSVTVGLELDWVGWVELVNEQVRSMHLFIHSFFQTAFTECLIYASTHARC